MKNRQGSLINKEHLVLRSLDIIVIRSLKIIVFRGLEIIVLRSLEIIIAFRKNRLDINVFIPQCLHSRAPAFNLNIRNLTNSLRSRIKQYKNTTLS